MTSLPPEQVILKERHEYMPCRICIELERFLQSAQQPDAPDLLLGLTEAGKRNRDHQNKEKILKAEMNLAKHKKNCTASQES